MLSKPFVITSVLSGLLSVHASGAVIFSENFESYADTTAMQAVWTGSTIGQLTADGFGGGNAMTHAGGTDNVLTIPGGDVSPSATDNVVLKGKIYDDGTGNKRISLGFRSTTTFPLFEMGMYNGPTNYAYRVTLFGGTNPSWQAVGTNPNPPVIGWNEFTATFSLDKVLVAIDFGSNGTVDVSAETALAGTPYATGLGQLRIGGPSNVSSAGGGARFDDISVSTVAVPEPASLALLSLGALLMGGRRRQHA